MCRLNASITRGFFRAHALLIGANNSASARVPSFSNHRTSCPWKGQARYYSLLVNGEMNPDAVWYYPEPSEAARQIKGRVAFWKGVKVE